MYISKLSEPTTYPLDQDMTKTWFVKYPNPKGGPDLKKYGKLASCKTLQEKLAEAHRIKHEELKTVSKKESSWQTLLIHNLEKSLGGHKTTGLKKKSKEQYDSHFKLFCEWFRKFGIHVSIELIGLEFMKYQSEQGLSNTTINNYRDTIGVLIRRIVKLRQFQINPFEVIC